MIDIEKAKEVLNNYIKKYDDTNPKIKLKKDHIFRVAYNSKQIAEKLKLSEEDIKLAEIIGLLHDIGRFEQLRIYNTFNDKKSIDHGLKGIEVLFNDNLIREFLEEKKYDQIINIAIKNHNRPNIEEGLQERELLHSKIIRDSDKIDIFNIIVNSNIEDAVWFPVHNIEYEKISDKVYKDMIENKLINYSNVQTNIDCIVTWIAYIYNINFDISLKILKKENYINRLVDRIHYKDIETKEKMEKLKKDAQKYIEEKMK